MGSSRLRPSRISRGLRTMSDPTYKEFRQQGWEHVDGSDEMQPPKALERAKWYSDATSPKTQGGNTTAVTPTEK